MTEHKPGFGEQIKSFPRTFWVANTMEIFERMAWYGFYAVSSLYITGPKETGGLGFTSEQRGAIQAMIPFLLYLMPVGTGALADRYGFKKMFIIAYVGMVVFYYLLGLFKSLSGFMVAFFFVAIAAAIFKPVVVGTVARVTNDRNSRLGFGVFYMMVNVGGFLGPIVAGLVRSVSWTYVFVASAFWGLVNLFICILFYREPEKPQGWKPRTPSQVWQTVYEVLGNARFFVTVFIVVIAMMVAQFGPWWFKWWPHAAIFIPAWIILNFVWDAVLPRREAAPAGQPQAGWLGQRMHCSDWRFALFLLILSGFWTAFNQIFLTMPEYIRDFSDTGALVRASRSIGGDDAAEWTASVEETELYAEVDGLLRRAAGAGPLVVDGDDAEEPDDANKLATLRRSLDDLIDSAGRLAGSRHLPDAVRQEARSIRAAAKAVDQDDASAIEAALAAHEPRIGELDRTERLAAYKSFPGITAEVIADLEEFAQELNRRGEDASGEGLDALVLLDSTRKVLGYKVRFAPADYARTLAGLPLTSVAPSDETLERGMGALNKRLKDYRQPTFNPQERDAVSARVKAALAQQGVLISADTLGALAAELSSSERQVDPKALALLWRHAAYRDALYPAISEARQFNPEFIVNINALGIVLFQVLISYLIGRFHQFTGMIMGMVVAAVGIGFAAVAGDHGFFGAGGIGLLVCLGILIFSFGEMMASPTSQEYVGRVAPEDKKALYMGYYFVAVALGNLFGGILSGELYGKLARDMQRPDLMWLAFGGIMLLTAAMFVVYNKVALPKTDGEAAAATA
ncbi:MAG: MFS transporter [Phycisphaerales bacterium]|nr:MAG: MFS transporter [Phycisphaerales bacterium]